MDGTKSASVVAAHSYRLSGDPDTAREQVDVIHIAGFSDEGFFRPFTQTKSRGCDRLLVGIVGDTEDGPKIDIWDRPHIAIRARCRVVFST